MRTFSERSTALLALRTAGSRVLPAWINTCSWTIGHMIFDGGIVAAIILNKCHPRRRLVVNGLLVVCFMSMPKCVQRSAQMSVSVVSGREDNNNQSESVATKLGRCYRHVIGISAVLQRPCLTLNKGVSTQVV